MIRIDGNKNPTEISDVIYKQLLKQLQLLKDSDAQMIHDIVPMLSKAANWIDMANIHSNESSDIHFNQLGKLKFSLNRFAGRNTIIWIEFLFGTLLSSNGENDLLKLNPYLSPENIKTIMDLITVTMLRSNRLGHTNRCIGTAINLENLIDKVKSP